MRHLLQGHYRFEGPTFPSIKELIIYQLKSGLPVTSRSRAILKTPILRECWELNNDDVILLDKIGRVSDVIGKSKIKNDVKCFTWFFREISVTYTKPS